MCLRVCAYVWLMRVVVKVCVYVYLGRRNEVGGGGAGEPTWGRNLKGAVLE